MWWKLILAMVVVTMGLAWCEKQSDRPTQRTPAQEAQYQAVLASERRQAEARPRERAKERRSGTGAAKAELLTKTLNATADGGMTCEAKAESKTILCIVNAVDGELSKLAGGVVLIANANDIPLTGWKLTMVNLDDYVVTRRF